MPSKWTFQVRPLIDIIFRYKQDGEQWIDPFSGFNSPCEITNDLNPFAPTVFHHDAHDLISIWDEPVDGAIFDPPYSLTQVSRSYAGLGLKFKGKENPTGGFPKVKDWLSHIIKPRGFCISYGWNTVGLGLKRGFDPVEYLICSHGGNRNDTLVTVEQKR
jgi:hypothetical protein